MAKLAIHRLLPESSNDRCFHDAFSFISPVVLVNVFTLDKADEETFLKAWQDDAVFMKRGWASSPPSFIAQSASPTYLNYAVWETNADFRAAFTHPEFRAKLSAYPSSAVASPHLFQKVAVHGIRVA
jgi:hypothetical protein